MGQDEDGVGADLLRVAGQLLSQDEIVADARDDRHASGGHLDRQAMNPANLARGHRIQLASPAGGDDQVQARANEVVDVRLVSVVVQG